MNFIVSISDLCTLTYFAMKARKAVCKMTMYFCLMKHDIFSCLFLLKKKHAKIENHKHKWMQLVKLPRITVSLWASDIKVLLVEFYSFRQSR